jgi:hypothetical protein
MALMTTIGVADRIADIVEKLSIKSAPRRVEALKRFINEVSVNYLIEELKPRYVCSITTLLCSELQSLVQ